MYNSFVLLRYRCSSSPPSHDQSAASRTAAELLQRVRRAFRGGLAHVNVVQSIIFAGMSGSALADAASRAS